MNQYLLALFILLISSCSLTPDYKKPSIETPKSWSNAESQNSIEISKNWWQEFGDRDLNQFIEEVLENNYRLKASLARIKQSRAAYKSARAGLFPTLNSATSSSVTQNRAGGNTTGSESSSASFTAAYEVDLFRTKDAAVESALAGLEGSRFTDQSLRLTIMSDTAKAYFLLLSLKERLKISNQDVKLAKQLLEIAELEFSTGRSTAIDLSDQKNNLASAISSNTSLQEQYDQGANALLILLAKPPEKLQLSKRSLTTISAPSTNPGLPSELLLRRPDIALAETSLIDANADIGAARAAFFPTLNLTSAASISKAGLVTSTPTSALSLASALAAPIFRAGSLEAGLESAKAKQEELVENYKQTILEALQETDDTITSLKSSNEQLSQSAKIHNEEIKSYKLNKQQYEVGSTRLKDLISAERTLLSSKSSYIQAKLTQLNDTVDLYKALGGGFKSNLTP